MKISILQQDFLPVLQAVSRVVSSRPTLPVLANIYLASEDNKLKVAATNLEIGLIKLVSAQVSEPGQITVPAKTLLDLISGLALSTIELLVNQDILTVSSGKFSATINGISANEFPAIPISGSTTLKLPKSVLDSCSVVMFASAVDEGRPVLTGVLTEIKSAKVDFVATDGFRLAHRQVSLPDSSFKFKALIPRRTLEEVLKVISEELKGSQQEKEEELIEVSTSENQNQVIFKIGLATISSRLIEGSFPNWEKILPSNIITRGVVEKEALLKAVKLASIFAKGEANIISLDLKKNGIVITSEAKEVGQQQNELECQLEGEEFKVAFNARFLLDALLNAPTTQLMMEFSGPLSPVLIKPVGIEGLQYVIMPVRIT